MVDRQSGPFRAGQTGLGHDRATREAPV